MKVRLRITSKLFERMLADLRRPHDFAYERVAFMFCKQSKHPSGILLFPYKYTPIRDDQYIADETVGARFDSSSIREAMQVALAERSSAFHVHLHSHAGIPGFSGTDNGEMQALMPCFANVRPDRVHGALVLSLDSAVARVWSADWSQGQQIKITIIGATMKFFG
jgi:hypothetical protein